MARRRCGPDHPCGGMQKGLFNTFFGPPSSSSSSTWILATGFWNDSGLWDDNAFWID